MKNSSKIIDTLHAEIERLNTRLTMSVDRRSRLLIKVSKQAAEIERLKAELADAKSDLSALHGDSEAI